MKYIPTEKLIAEIERRMKDYNVSIEKYYNKQKSIKAERDSWKWAECKWFLSLITSLQQEQPEVDLEREILDWIGDEGSCKNGKWTWAECNKMLRYFYELGFNARKEE